MSDQQSLEVQVHANPESLLQVIAKAVANPLVDVEKMRALFELQKEILAEERKVVFMAALSRLQAKLPQITKYGQAKNSKFAKLQDIDVVIRPLLSEEGFSLTFDEESSSEKTSTFIMTMGHEAGHRETKRLTVPIDVASKNREGNSVRPAIQDAGSTVSYARRYLLKMHLNIIEKDEDTDGEPRRPITEQQVTDLKIAAEQAGVNIPRFLFYMGVGDFNEILQRDWKKALTAIEAKATEVKK